MDLEYIPHPTPLHPKLIQEGFSSSWTYCVERFPTVEFQFGQRG